MKNVFKILSAAVAVSAILSSTTALADDPVGTTCDAFATAYATVDQGGAPLKDGDAMHGVEVLVKNIHKLEDYPAYKNPYIVLKGGDVGTLDGFIGLHLPADGWKYVYHCKPESGVATIMFDVTNGTDERQTQSVSFDVLKQPGA